MIIDSKKRFCLDSPNFDKMRQELDDKIRMSLPIMNQKGISCAKITLKIDIDTHEETLRDDNSPTGTRDALIPNVKYAITFKLEAKSDTSGVVANNNNELVRGTNNEYYIITPEEASGQLNMFNNYDEIPRSPHDSDDESLDESNPFNEEEEQ